MGGQRIRCETNSKTLGTILTSADFIIMGVGAIGTAMNKYAIYPTFQKSTFDNISNKLPMYSAFGAIFMVAVVPGCSG